MWVTTGSPLRLDVEVKGEGEAGQRQLARLGVGGDIGDKGIVQVAGG